MRSSSGVKIFERVAADFAPLPLDGSALDARAGVEIEEENGACDNFGERARTPLAAFFGVAVFFDFTGFAPAFFAAGFTTGFPADFLADFPAGLPTDFFADFFAVFFATVERFTDLSVFLLSVFVDLDL